MPVHQHPAAFPPPAYSASRPAHAPHSPRPHGQTCAGSRTPLAPAGAVFPSLPLLASNHHLQPHPAHRKTSDDRCPEKRHSVRYLWIPVRVFDQNRLFLGGGVHFYCVGGRFSGHLSFEAGRTWHQRRAPRPALTSDLRVRTLRVRRGVLVAGKRGSCPQILSNRPGFAGKTCQDPSYLTPPARNKRYFLAGLHSLVAARGEKVWFCSWWQEKSVARGAGGVFCPWQRLI